MSVNHEAASSNEMFRSWIDANFIKIDFNKEPYTSETHLSSLTCLSQEAKSVVFGKTQCGLGFYTKLHDLYKEDIKKESI